MFKEGDLVLYENKLHTIEWTIPSSYAIVNNLTGEAVKHTVTKEKLTKPSLQAGDKVCIEHKYMWLDFDILEIGVNSINRQIYRVARNLDGKMIDKWITSDKILDITSSSNIKYTIKKCECGAKYTSFPDHHLDWCPMFEKKKRKRI
ncbi:MAG: hypothetical protein GTN36_02680 [Candidatus Aenigmarchaeota archaeon]|nr:hypothetical protein [Candidatus Aenigmarchaeota archaeon]